MILTIITLPYRFGLVTIYYTTYLNKLLATEIQLQAAHKILSVHHLRASRKLVPIHASINNFNRSLCKKTAFYDI